MALGPNHVMIAYGRNKKARDAMFQFIRSLGLQPIEWEDAISEAGGGSPYSGTVAKNAIEKAGAVLILLTADDIGKLRERYANEDDGPDERHLRGQARLNVIVELGMALMTRDAQTIIVELEKTRSISDTWGRNSIRYSASNKAEFRQRIRSRLEAAGCGVKATGTDWLTCGHFAGSIAPVAHSETTEATSATGPRQQSVGPKEVKNALHLAINRLKDNNLRLGRLSLLNLVEVDADQRVYLSAGRNEYELERFIPELQAEMRAILGSQLDLRFVRDILR